MLELSGDILFELIIPIYIALVIFLFCFAIVMIFLRRKLKRSEKILVDLDFLEEDILNAEKEFKIEYNKNIYFSKRTFYSWYEKWKHIKPILERFSEMKSHRQAKAVGNADLRNSLYYLHEVFVKGWGFIKERNNVFVERECEAFKSLFDTLESYPLTKNQRRAIVTDECNNLVVAGAGTGKTSTLIGKASYIFQKKLAKPHETLLISFSKEVRREIDERILPLFGQKPIVETFHSLGYDIIANTEEIRPSVSRLSKDRDLLTKTIEEFILRRSADQEFLRKLNEYFAFYRTPYESKFNFKSESEYIDFLHNNQVRSLKGDLVRSLEECEIANFLYLNGIGYVYEDPYEIKTASRSHRQYKPDFHLPKYGIYIEHFGVDRKNKTAPFVERKKYLADMTWKRRTHKENHTTLVETYSWEKFEGVLLENLEKKLALAGVEFTPIPPEQIFEKLNNLGLVHPFAALIATFLNLFKSSQKSIEELLEQSKEFPNYMRKKIFVEIFSEIYHDYERSLGEEIDFNDMIIKAEKYLTEHMYHSEFKYILVDEFQDMSYGRFRLLKALLDQNPSTKLFCVGDDWQSIYRFTGGDISIMTDFDRYFNPSERLELDKTFRFDNKLCDFSTRFVLKNPNQTKKRLTSDKESIDPSVTLLWNETDEDTISEILTRIDTFEEKGAEVFIIGRYNHQKPSNLTQFRKEHPKLSINYTTAHSSKGKQSDYVIVIGLTSQGYAFPSQIEDDPVLDLVLAKKERIPNAEERRLFYVAVTRTKKHVYLVASRNYPSTFASEIEKGEYEVTIEGRRASKEETETPFMDWVRTQESSSK